ncbi:hypothetical protein GCM10007859_04700 [Brevundimonas denitrificans]|uniref:DoxX family protein n=2 Tax=Brevundimonas denitrificans TaxID=1443434 RepID=A0ABQ6BFM9_9CAUL|nr:hypothetical protein GCM10007859_04700 [Brevundimonas denitrificans]
MVTLTLRALAERVMRSDIATVANQESALPGVAKMTTQTLTPARARLNASYRNLTLWTLQGWIAMFFIAAGYAKLSEPMENLVELMRWPALVAPEMVRGLGVAEIILAVLVLAPLVSWTHGRPLLVMAASGLLALEAAMLTLHAAGMDVGPAVTNLILIAMTATVLWKRAREVR